MIVAVIVMIVLAVALIAYVLEPVIRARVDRVELDTAVDTPPVPDFRALLETDQETVTQEGDAQDTAHTPPNTAPAEHRS